MITEIAGVMSSLKAAGDITKALVGLRDAQALQSKVIELQSLIMEAQSGAMNAQTAHSICIERVRGLEKQIADLETWDREKDRYHLVDANPRASVFVYVLKPEAQGSEPAHALCANCYHNGKKSILQATPYLKVGLRVHECHQCNSELVFAGMR